ncbi:MAG: DNA repair protein RadA [Patescibacteria group bacterium]|nr:DNA repair protein RadA [Patescibacteria group bacterium]
MSKQAAMFICSNCDAQYTKWVGRCLECGKWGTVESARGGFALSEKSQKETAEFSPIKTLTLNEIEGKNAIRIKTNINELDRVLGGGIVPGSLILLGGEPGVGKSTLAIQLSSILPNSLYISGEESTEQIKLRAERLDIKAPNLRLANETNVENISATIKQKFSLAVIDSIQTIYSEEIDSEPGNPNQLRACAVKLMETAKSSNTAVIIIGHVTKEGVVAGPKTLEHLVDTVLYLEGDQRHQYRILRAVKNRFGPTNEVGIFSMEENGLAEVKNPSASFLSERANDLAGNVITCLMEGTRPILVEIQALVTKTAFGYPTRKANGFDINRLHMIIAVLQKRAGLRLEQYDIHLNVAGGLRAEEPAADLAVALAIASACKDKVLGFDIAAFGEIGLGGEIRTVANAEKRIKECEQLGLKKIIMARGTNPNKKSSEKQKIADIKIMEIKTIGEVFK